MNRVRCVLPLLDILIVEASEIRCKGVPIQEQGVVSVDLLDRSVQTIAELDKPCVSGFCGLIERAVTGYPRVIFVVVG